MMGEVIKGDKPVDTGDVERQVAQRILSADITPDEGQVSIADFERKNQ